MAINETNVDVQCINTTIYPFILNKLKWWHQLDKHPKQIGIFWRTQKLLSVYEQYVVLFRDNIWTMKVYKLSIKYICLSICKILVTLRFNTKLCSDDLSILPVALVFYCTIHFLHSISHHRESLQIFKLCKKVLSKTNVLSISLYNFFSQGASSKTHI